MAVADIPSGLLGEGWSGMIFSTAGPRGVAATTVRSSRRPVKSSGVSDRDAGGRRNGFRGRRAARNATGPRTGYQERAAIIRMAGDLWKAHADEIHTWIMRETGAIPPKAQLETWFAASTCYDAAALHPSPMASCSRHAIPC